MIKLRYLGWNLREVTRPVVTLSVLVVLGGASLVAIMGGADERRVDAMANATIFVLAIGAAFSFVTSLRCSLVVGPGSVIVTNVYRRRVIPLGEIRAIGLTLTWSTSRPVIAIRSEPTSHGLLTTTPVFAVSDEHLEDAVRAFAAVGVSFGPETFFLAT